MPIDISTQTTSKAVFDRIVNRLTNSTFMGGAGNVWDKLCEYQCWTGVSTAIKADATKNRHSYVLKGKGLAGTDNIFVGLAYSERVATAPFADSGLPATGNVRLFGFQKYVAIMDGVTVFNYKGAWSSSSVSYTAGHVVTFGGVDYLCLKAHTSAAGTGNAPDVVGQTTWTAGIAGYVGEYANIGQIVLNNYIKRGTKLWKVTTALLTAFPAWSSATTYSTLDNKISYNGAYYRNINASGNLNKTPDSNPSFWLAVADADFAPGYPAWDSSRAYALNDKVNFGSQVYISTTGTSNTNRTPDNTGTFWSLVSAEVLAAGGSAVQDDLPSAYTIYTEQTPFRGEWAAGIAYLTNDYVSYGGSLDKALSGHTSSIGAGTGPTGSKSGTYWAPHTPHYKSQGFGVDRNGRFTEDEGFIDNWQTGLCWSGFHKMWAAGTGDIPTWIVANTRRFMWVTKSSTTRWAFSYVGFLKPFGTDCTNPYPLMLSANGSKISIAPLTADKVWEDQHAPFDFVEEDNIGGQDQFKVQNYPINGAASRFSRLDLQWVTAPTPYPYSTEGPLGTERLPTGENYLREVWLNDGTGFVGALDGVYWCAAQGMASGDILTANSVDYLLVENVYRASSGGMFAIALV